MEMEGDRHTSLYFKARWFSESYFGSVHKDLFLKCVRALLRRQGLVCGFIKTEDGSAARHHADHPLLRLTHLMLANNKCLSIF